MILFDTDTVTHFSYGNENVRRKIDEVGDDGQLAIAIITRYEILRGRADSLLKAANEEELRKAVERFQQAEEMLSAFLVVSFDETAINHFEALRQQKTFKKRRADLLIACIALANNALLVTRNTKDFKHVSGLRMENWVD